MYAISASAQHEAVSSLIKPTDIVTTPPEIFQHTHSTTARVQNYLFPLVTFILLLSVLRQV